MNNEELTSFAHQPLQNEPDNDNYLRSVSNNNYNSNVFEPPTSNSWSKSPGQIGINTEQIYPQMSTRTQQVPTHFQSKSRNLMEYDEF